MMFLVIFGSLAAAMAVVAQGNLRTANSGLQVSRAMSAAETGLVFASLRLQTEGEKFVIDKGVVDSCFGERLWMGTYSSLDGTVTPPDDAGPGIAHAVLAAHANDQHSFNAVPGDAGLPTLNGSFGTVRAKPIALEANEDGSPNVNGPYFRLRYELVSCPLDDVCDCDPYIRVTSEGVDGTIARTLQMDFRITKKLEFAILSVNRVMIGKNVIIEGPLGTRYGVKSDGSANAAELDCVHCHPLLMRSDFRHLSDDLDQKLDSFYGRVADYDADGDGRLRPNHPDEGPGLSGSGFSDVTGDGYVDDFDIFLQEYDSNGDGRVLYDSDKAAAAGISGAVEFHDDPQLAQLLDRAIPDRNGDGRIDGVDRMLGYNDGVVDARDRYAKLRGRLGFAVARDDWESYHDGASYQEIAVAGAIRPGIDRPAVTFEISDEQMLEITTDMFDESHDWFKGEAVGVLGDDSSGQVLSQLSSGGGAEYIPANDPDHPYGYEGVPFGSPSPYDYYLRPIYRNMTFTNVTIPVGNNGLFENCTFIGVTFIDTEPDNTHEDWNIAGQTEPTGVITSFGTVDAFELPDGSTGINTRDFSNNIRFHNCTFLGSISGVRPQAYTHWRNKVQMTGEIRFYLDPEDPDLLEDEHPDKATWISHLQGLSSSDVEEMEKSSILMPGWSFDVGAFTSDPDADPADVPRIKLQGVIIAGILDIRGNADVHGTLLLTYRPTPGEGALSKVQPDCSSCMASLKTTIGFFGPDDGDQEGIGYGEEGFEGFGEILIRYNPDGKLPDGVPWPLKIEPVTASYNEGQL